MTEQKSDHAVVERWVDVEGWPDYEVSNLGRVCRKGRKACPRYWRNGKLVERIAPKLLVTKTGSVDLRSFKYKGKTAHLPIAHLVLNAFVGPRPSPEHIARHLDADVLNNVLENLAWWSREDVSNSLKGKRRSIASRQKQGATRIARGIRHSEETRRRMSESHKRNHAQRRQASRGA